MGDLSDLSIFLTMPVLHFLKLCQPIHVATFFTAGWWSFFQLGSGCGALMDLATLLALTFWEWVPKVFFVLSAINDAFLMFFFTSFQTRSFSKSQAKHMVVYDR